MQVRVVDAEGNEVDKIDLPDDIFADEVREALMWECVKAQRASWRRGTHSTKTRAHVSGGGAKPYKQKGTGQARQGSSRAPNHVGGGVVFGPHPRDYSYRLPRTARRAALCSALSLRASENAIVVLRSEAIETPKTKAALVLLAGLETHSALVVGCQEEALRRSVRNLQRSKGLDVGGLNVYDILNHRTLVLTQAALEELVRRVHGTTDDETGAQEAA
jgi:large subunit ribosomal protein L4